MFCVYISHRPGSNDNRLTIEKTSAFVGGAKKQKKSHKRIPLCRDPLKRVCGCVFSSSASPALTDVFVCVSHVLICVALRRVPYDRRERERASCLSARHGKYFCIKSRTLCTYIRFRAIIYLASSRKHESEQSPPPPPLTDAFPPFLAPSLPLPRLTPTPLSNS